MRKSAPDVLFKYMKRKYATELILHGRMRIGTLEYYKLSEHNDEVRDSEEGTKVVFFSPKEKTVISSQNPGPSFLREIITPVGTGKLVMHPGAKVQKTYRSPNFLIYCTTSRFDQLLMSEFGCDTCVKVEHPLDFFRYITRYLPRGTEFLGLYPCLYRPRELPHSFNDKYHPAIIKDPRYAKQREWRALWHPKNDFPAAYLDIECRLASRYCSLVPLAPYRPPLQE